MGKAYKGRKVMTSIVPYRRRSELAKTTTKVEYLTEEEAKKHPPLGKVSRNPAGSKKKFHVYVRCNGRVKKNANDKSTEEASKNVNPTPK